MNRTEKTQWAKDFSDKLGKSKLAVFADYKGLGAVDADLLRKKLRGLEVEVKVMKNNVARKAVADNPSEDVKSVMDNTVGPTLVAFAYGDPAAAAKTLDEFSKEHEALQLKDSLMEGKLLKVGQIKELADLPSKEVMVAILLGTMKAPVRNFVGVLAAVPRSLLYALKAIEQKKQG